MKKHPYHYTGNDFKRILNKSVRIISGNQFSNKDDRIIEGKITYCCLASNYPHAPFYVDFKLVKGEKIRINITDMKSIDVL